MATATKFANANTIVTTGWTSPTNAYADDAVYATAAPAASSSITTDYGFAAFTTGDIPAGSMITDITFEVQYKSNSTTATGAVIGLQENNNGTLVGSETTAGMTLTDALLTKSYTSTSGSTGTNLVNLRTANLVKARVRGFRSTGGAITWSIDYVKITVTYTAPGDAPSVVNSAAGGTDGVTCTQGSGGNTGGTSGQYWSAISTAGVLKFKDESNQMYGTTKAYRLTQAASPTFNFATWDGAICGPCNDARIAFAFNMASIPSADIAIFELQFEGNSFCFNKILSTGAVILIDSTFAGKGTSSALTAGQTYWLEWRFVGNTSANAVAGVGWMEVKIWDASGVLLQTIGGSGATGTYSDSMTKFMWGQDVFAANWVYDATLFRMGPGSVSLPPPPNLSTVFNIRPQHIKQRHLLVR